MKRFNPRADAMKSFAKDSDYATKKDVDIKATDKDMELAKKNIIVQLKKSADSNGNFAINFADGKKKKLAIATVNRLLNFHDTLKPESKLKFAEVISKSYAQAVSVAKMKLESALYDESLEELAERKESHHFTDLATAQKKAREIGGKLITGKGKSLGQFMVVKEDVTLDEMKMDDPKLNKIFDKLKKGQTIKLKTSSTISKGADFVDYIVKSKNTVNKGKVEKVTLVTKGNEKVVKKFLYKRDGKVTFAIGDMAASIDDIKEEVDLDEAKTPKELTPKAVEDRLVFLGVNPKDAKKAVKQGFAYANKKYGGETYAKALKKVAEVVWFHAEEVDLDEGFTPAQISALKKSYESLRGKRISPENGMRLSKMLDKLSKEDALALDKADIPFVSTLAVNKLIMKYKMSAKDIIAARSVKKEDVDLEDESINEAKYTIKNGKLHIKKADFKKTHKDYKNATKGKERMVALDPKTGATVSYPVVLEKIGPDDEKDSGEYDYEGEMAKNDLKTLIDAGQEIYEYLEDDDNLPEWVQAKITKATDYIDSVRDYLKSENDS
jgi:hypothetical protein